MKFSVYEGKKKIIEFNNGEILTDEGTKNFILTGLKVAEERGTILGDGYEPARPYSKDALAVRLFCEGFVDNVSFTGDVPEYPLLEDDGEGYVTY